MKMKYKLGTVALALVAMTSCEINDPFNDVMEVGQPVPTVYWSLSSSVGAAGSEVEFTGQYYTDKEHTPDHSEVWETLVCKEKAVATLGVLTPNLKYSSAVNSSDTIRTAMTASFPHSDAVWVDDYAWNITGKLPISKTLKPVKWANAKEWSQETFDSYYPEGFEEEFVKTVVDYLTKDNTYLNDLKNVYLKYDFTAEQFAAANAAHPEGQLPTEVDPAKKSDLWFTDLETVAGKYYTTVEGEGDDKTLVYHEVAVEDATDENLKYEDVYASSAWLFCYYDDDKGAVVTRVRDEYLPTFKDLISNISFPEWIFTANNEYNVSFERQYSLSYVFKVFDTVGNVGYTTEEKVVEIN